MTLTWSDAAKLPQEPPIFAGTLTDKLGRSAHIGNGSTPRRETTVYWDGGDFPWLNSSVVNESRVTRAEQP
jgi:type I restriction enzyme S subunit